MIGNSLASLNGISQALLNPITLVSLYDCEMSIGARFRQLRHHLKLSGDEIGLICGVTKGMVSQWESDDSIPTPERLIALANKHPYSIDWLLTGHGDMDHICHLSEPQHKLITRMAAMTEREQYRVVRMVEAFADDVPSNDDGEQNHCGERELAG